MSHFEQEKTQAPNLPHQGIVINWDNALFCFNCIFNPFCFDSLLFVNYKM